MLDEDTLKQTWDLTVKAYDKACKKVGYTNMELREAINDWLMTDEEACNKADALDEVYREIICKLPSYVLQNIIIAAENEQQRRGQKTIDRIATELFERELNKNGNT